MYDKERLLREFSGLIGLRKSLDAGNPDVQIDDQVQESLTGIYVNDLNTSLFTLENLANCVPNFPTFSIDTYSSIIQYKKGDVVKDSSGNVFESLQSSLGVPVSDSDYWVETNLFSIWFRQQYDAAVIAMLDDLISYSDANQYGRQLQDKTAMIASDGRRTNIIEKGTNRFVGFLFRVKQYDLSCIVNRIGMQLTGQVSSIPIYLYHSTSISPIASWRFTGNNPNRFTYLDVKSYDLSMNSSDGYYLLGYYEEDLPVGVNAIYSDTTIFKASGCGSCNSGDLSRKLNWSRYIDITPVYISDVLQPNGFTWDESDMTISDQNMGIDMAFSFRCHLTRLFIEEKDSLVNLLKERLRYQFTQALANNVRKNSMSNEIANLAYTEIKDFNSALNPERSYMRALKNAKMEFSTINPMCVKAKEKNTIRYRVIN